MGRPVGDIIFSNAEVENRLVWKMIFRIENYLKMYINMTRFDHGCIPMAIGYYIKLCIHAVVTGVRYANLKQQL